MLQPRRRTSSVRCVHQAVKWYVPIGGTYHEVQPHQVLDGPNPTGHAVVWYDGDGNHVTNSFCFAPGPLY